MSADMTNVCVVIHEPELVTVTITTQQLEMLRIMCDVIRDDDHMQDIPAFADALYQEIIAEQTEAAKHE